MAEETSNKWLPWALGFVALVAIGVAVWLWLHPRETTLVKDRFLPAEQLERVADVPRVRVACPPAGIVALDKQAAAQKLALDWLLYKGQGKSLPEAPRPVAQGALSGAPGDTALVTPPAIASVPPAAGLEILTTADLPESEAGTEVVALFDPATGVTTIDAKEKEPALFAFENRGQLAAWYGYNQHLMPAADVTGQWTFLRVMKVHLGVRGEVGDSGGRVQAGIIYEW